jgi:hypothetical protein
MGIARCFCDLFGCVAIENDAAEKNSLGTERNGMGSVKQLEQKQSMETWKAPATRHTTGLGVKAR